MHIEPAELAFDDNGIPWSPRFGDVYHSAESGPGQARHVFIAGNDLPQRWQGERIFSIVETGFGIGLNFLATWQAWRDDPARCERLHFVSIEKYPFSIEALERLHARYPELAPYSKALRDAWPTLVSGLHRLHFEEGRVTLTLALGDVEAILPRLRLTADAVYLDGFAPSRNAEMWSPRVIKAIAKLCASGATAATYSSAVALRENLEAAGFIVQKQPGFGRKREMLTARYAPRFIAPRQKMQPIQERRAIVVGAGLAGAAVTERLANRGWRIDLVESQIAPTNRGDAFAGVFHPHLSGDDSLRSRGSRAGFLYAVRHWQGLDCARQPIDWNRCGSLQLANERDQEMRMVQAIATLQPPAQFARYVDRVEAERIAGCRLRSGGWHFQGAGWIAVDSLVRAQIAAGGDNARVHSGRAVQSIAHEGERWIARDDTGASIAEAPTIILANAADAQRLCAFGDALARIRGHVSFVPADATVAPRIPVTGRGYVLPPRNGVVVVGSTYDQGDDPNPQALGHETNLAHLARLLPDATTALNTALLDGAVGFRCAAPDRMPMIGSAPDLAAIADDRVRLTGARLVDLPRLRGVHFATAFASHGLVWTTLAAETLASALEGEPLPIECDLADAIDPARFISRRIRRGRF